MRVLCTVVLLAVLAILLPTRATGDEDSARVPHSASMPSSAWQWPVVGVVSISAPYQQPADDYSAGHRGIDLRVGGDAPVVVAPASGTIAWVGTVADRPLLTISHDNSLVTTLEPVVASVEVGSFVTAGTPVGTVTSGGHAAPGTVHWGVRQNGRYINPATLFSRIARPILLPCCEE